MEQRSDRVHVQVSVDDHAVDVRAAGEIDIATVAAFRSALWAAPARPVLRLDLSGVRLLSAAGVRALVAAHRRVRSQGGELVLVDPDPVVSRVLRVTGLHRVIRIVGSGAVPPAAWPTPTSGAVPPAARPASGVVASSAQPASGAVVPSAQPASGVAPASRPAPNAARPASGVLPPASAPLLVAA